MQDFTYCLRGNYVFLAGLVKSGNALYEKKQNRRIKNVENSGYNGEGRHREKWTHCKNTGEGGKWGGTHTLEFMVTLDTRSLDTLMP